MLNFYGEQYIWFMGVVEDRNDPDKLGRVRVRCFGIHTADTTKIPTNMLPWAWVMQPTTSASVNGIGQSPTGILEGTHVVGFFRDGLSMQDPVVTGTLGGVPQTPPYLTRSQIVTTPEDRAAVFNNGIKPDGEAIEPIKEIERNPNLDINLLIIHCTATRPSQDIGVAEVNSWHIQRGWREIGYHFVIRRNGVVERGRDVGKQGAHAKGYNRKSIGIAMAGGVDDNLQPQNNFTPAQWASLKTMVGKYMTDYEGIKVIGHNEVSAKACPSFNVQTWLANTFPDGQVDEELLAGLEDDTVEDQEGAKQLEQADDDKNDVGETEAYADDVASGAAVRNDTYPENTFGFIDPNGVYPKEPYIGEQDVNRLSRGEQTDETVVQSKNDSRETGINLPGGGTYDEPQSPYNAQYPYNHVQESESGHLIEVDDTPGQERIHMYHRTGTFFEMHPDGNEVHKVIGDGYEITLKNKNIYVKGSCNITVDGDTNLKVGGNVTAEVEGDLDASIVGKVNFDAKGEIVINSDTEITMTAPNIYLN